MNPPQLYALWDDRGAWLRTSDGMIDVRSKPDGLLAHLAYRAKSSHAAHLAEAEHGHVVELCPRFLVEYPDRS